MFSQKRANRELKMPKVTGFIYRRLSSDDAGRTSLLKLAAETPDAVLKLDLLNALVQAARNGHQITKPDGWSELRQKVASALAEPHPDAAKAAATLLELEASMGIETALATYRDLLASASARTWSGTLLASASMVAALGMRTGGGD